MIYKDKDGNQVPYVLAYYNGGIEASNLDKAQQIMPSEEYWSEIMGVREPDGNPEEYLHTDKDIYSYLTNYWVRKDLYAKIVEKCIEINIAPEHADNLSIPLSDCPMAWKMRTTKKNMKSHGLDMEKLRKLFLELEEFPALKFTKLTIEYGQGPFYNSDKKKLEIIDSDSISIKSDVVLNKFVSALKRLFKEDDKFRNSIISAPELQFLDFSYLKFEKRTKDLHMAIIAEYLINTEVCKNVTDATGKAAMLLSIHDHVLSMEEFIKAENKHLRNGYKKYEDYVLAKSENAYVISKESFLRPENAELQIEYETYEKYVGDLARKRYKSLKDRAE
jgi:hypothetical protein